MYGKILVPVDGSEPSTVGLVEAIKIAKKLGSRICLAHFVNEFVFDYGGGAGVFGTDIIDVLRKGGRGVLERAKAVVQDEGITSECVLLESMGGRAADLILAQAKAWSADLIVMGTHGRRGLARVAMGSDAEEVVRGAEVPVLLVRGTSQPPRMAVKPDASVAASG
ncbi:MAG: universal stress protein [Steroidobacteraceae bacterium]|jgi:nucleotide-binding universal stress UspA family protein